MKSQPLVWINYKLSNNQTFDFKQFDLTGHTSRWWYIEYDTNLQKINKNIIYFNVNRFYNE